MKKFKCNEDVLQGWVVKSQGRVVRNPVNVNRGLNVNWSIIFSCLKMLFTSNVWFSSRLLQLKTEGQTIEIERLTKKLQKWNQNSRQPRVSFNRALNNPAQNKLTQS